ncbi:hypothetical protein VaNZ11_016376 [Volvox africanus]|uniref:Lactation elevated protein 1 n=1 Tax=Volvox africanus TaxID=51714 RepID=A0ABQ5SMN5_9CHLO|nr:hypothetical protein VaNZ11_016376 [Volvox africanus]
MNNTTRRLFMLRVFGGLGVHSPLKLASPVSACICPLTNITITTPCPNPNLGYNIAVTGSRSIRSFSTASTSSQNIDGVQTRTATPFTATITTSNNSSGSNSNVNPVLQRYSQLVESGTLKADAQQLALVQELARLYDEICSYKARMDEYHRGIAEHQARRLKRLRELLSEEAREEEEGERRREGQQAGQVAAARKYERAKTRWRSVASGVGAGSASVPAPLSSLLDLGSWFMNSVVAPLTRGSNGAGRGSAVAASDSPLVRARQAAVRREERLEQEIGPPPSAPEPPKGMYVWGSVGSGKSMLVAMFYQALAENVQLPATRWMHFNAAMLEVHSRLHYLDTERWRLRDERESRHHQHRLQQQQQQQDEGLHEKTCSERTERQFGTQTISQPKTNRHHDDLCTSDMKIHHLGEAGGEEDVEEDGEEVVAATAATAGDRIGMGVVDDISKADLPVPEHLQGVFRHWDPRHDPEVQRQREAKAAMLAVRRHMRLARLGRNDPRTLAAANAQGLVRMAASFIRGRAGDPRSGWGSSSGPIASLLYLDEVQVTDVFSAVALKGLVEALTSAGCVLVCTSNRAPADLPRHGLHEDMWAHFVDTLQQCCTVHELSADNDYRRLILEQGRASIASAAAAAAVTTTSGSGSSAGGGAGALWPPLTRSYILPAGPAGTAELERLWQALAEGAGDGTASSRSYTTVSQQEREEPQRSLSVPVLFGRSLEVRRRSPCGGAAWFGFGELCGRPLGPADYVALSQRFHTVFLEGIPAMSMHVRDQARRFITLVDELYNSRCVLVASAEVAPQELFAGAEGQEPILDLEGMQFETAVEGARLRRDVRSSGGVAPVAASPAALAAAMGALGGAEEQFAFRRAVSRLLEMQSPQYILEALRMRCQQVRIQI